MEILKVVYIFHKDLVLKAVDLVKSPFRVDFKSGLAGLEN